MISIKRVYDVPEEKDGKRFLVERLWPRGMRKSELIMDGWLKDPAPSTQLRQWFGHDPKKWDEFQIRYRKELEASLDVWMPTLAGAARQGNVTLLYSARDTQHNNALVLKYFLETLVTSR